MAERRRVLLFVYWLSARAGMEQQAIHLARGLARAGDEVTVAYAGVAYAAPEFALIAPEASEQYTVDALRDEGIRTVDLHAQRAGRRYASIPRFARLAAQADVVHCTGWDASLWGRLAAVLARRPVVVTEHSPGRETQTSFGRLPGRKVIAWHNRLLDRATFRTVAVASRQVPMLVAEGIAPEKIDVIPNGIPLDELRTAGHGTTREDLGIPADARVVLQASRFAPQKRQEWTYRAVRALRDELGDVHVLFAGSGERLEEVRAIAEADGSSWAHFLGHRRDIPALLALADLVVLPSAAEALPIAVIEALVLGVPQVATDVGDTGAVLRSTGAGIAVDPDDEEQFVAACRRVLTEDGLAAAMREAARTGAEQFGVERMVARYDELLGAAVASRRSS